MSHERTATGPRCWFTLVALIWTLPSVAGSISIQGHGGGSISVPATSMKEARFLGTVRQQFDFSCGSAAISTLLSHHYRFPVTEETVFQAMFQHGNQQKIRESGFSLLDMKRYLEAEGFEADGFEAPLDKLAVAGVPAIVLVNEAGYNHFVVVKGLRDGRILLGDPAGGTRAMARTDFEAVWVNKLLFVITNRQEMSAFNLPEDWRVAPKAPVSMAVNRDVLGTVPFQRLGPSDF